jgi:hypothetical protein
MRMPYIFFLITGCLVFSGCRSHPKFKWTEATITDGEYKILFSRQPDVAFQAKLIIHDCGNLQMIIYSKESGVTNDVWLGGTSDNSIITMAGEMCSPDKSSSVYYYIQCSESNAYFEVDAKNSENKTYQADTPWNPLD